jgi:hypothetical protein
MSQVTANQKYLDLHFEKQEDTNKWMDYLYCLVNLKEDPDNTVMTKLKQVRSRGNKSLKHSSLTHKLDQGMPVPVE